MQHAFAPKSGCSIIHKMGIQDRDYYREHHANLRREASVRHGPSVPSAHSSFIRPLVRMVLLVLVVFALFWMYKATEKPALRLDPTKQQKTQPALAAEIEPESSRHRQSEAERQANIRRIQAAAELDVEEAARRAAQAKTARFEKAWASYFAPSPACKDAPATVTCANEYIRARRDFEARFNAK